MADGAPDDASRGRDVAARTVAISVGVGLAVALVGFAMVYAMLAVPFYALAQATEPSQGLDRPFIRDGILRVALPVGLVAGLAAGAVVGTWYGRGGRLPSE